jgi:hypothetical protein
MEFGCKMRLVGSGSRLVSRFRSPESAASSQFCL